MGRCGLLVLVATGTAAADAGDPQVRTDHPWYPGELACSTFPRLFATQAEVYRRVTGRAADTDEDKALASWLWRNTHYWHSEEGAEDLWGQGHGKGADPRGREYWTGLFAHGFGLCGTTHSQWVGEFQALLGHGRGRSVGADGHNAFEAFITGGEYGAGRWVLLDHDLSCVLFDPDGRRLLGLGEVSRDWKRLADRAFRPARQRGWLPVGLHPGDGASYGRFAVAEYLSGYAGPPPTVRLRRGETLTRHLQPGLADGRTFVFWGKNYNTAGVPGPERSRTWVNQPERMFGSTTGTDHVDGQARFANAVFRYAPDFRTGDYREGVVDEDDRQVTFEFSSPYVIAATPPNSKPWGVYDLGCRNGLVVRGRADCRVEVSVDRGRTWRDGGRLADGPDLTDRVKGFRQYRLRLHAPAAALRDSGLEITTVCQANGAVMPRLTDGANTVRYEAGRRGLVSAGPTVPQSQTHVVAGAIGSPAVTLEVRTPRGQQVRTVYAAAHLASGSPPDPAVKYHIDLSTDGGQTWRPVVADWTVTRRGEEPTDFWSQSLCWGSAEVDDAAVSSVRVRFRNTGGKRVLRPEVHLAYDTGPPDPVRVTFGWRDATGERTASHTFVGERPEPWRLDAGTGVQTRWVRFEPSPPVRP